VRLKTPAQLKIVDPRLLDDPRRYTTIHSSSRGSKPQLSTRCPICRRLTEEVVYLLYREWTGN
jgi:hypothetical protein